jgi:hypothetical protein
MYSFLLAENFGGFCHKNIKTGVPLTAEPEGSFTSFLGDSAN